jgi:antirestriction protein ArdC
LRRYSSFHARRSIADAATAVANRDRSKKITADVRSEIFERRAEYIADCLQLLKQNERAIFGASLKASQAADFLGAFSEAEKVAA